MKGDFVNIMKDIVYDYQHIIKILAYSDISSFAKENIIYSGMVKKDGSEEYYKTIINILKSNLFVRNKERFLLVFLNKD